MNEVFIVFEEAPYYNCTPVTLGVYDSWDLAKAAFDKIEKWDSMHYGIESWPLNAPGTKSNTRVLASA